jgi:carbon monoxide dehydrogenase subunit G
MRLEQSFDVPVPAATAWKFFLDLEQVAPCMPGATLTGYDGTGFSGLVKVKLGPISLSYKGNGRFVERDEPGKRVSFIASGQDSRGAGGASARVTAVLHETNGGTSTTVKVVADLDIAGRAAQFGRGMIADVSGKLVKQFADCLARTIAAAPVEVPAPVAAAPVVSAPAVPAPSVSPFTDAPVPVPAPAATGPAPTSPFTDEPPAPLVAAPPVAPPLSPFTDAAPAPAAPAPAASAAPAPVSEPVAPESVALPEPVAEEPVAPEPVVAERVAEPAAPEPVVAEPVASAAAEPEYHPLATQEPPAGSPPIVPVPAPPVVPEPEPVPRPESVYAYQPEPPVEAPAATPSPAAPAAPPTFAPQTLSRPPVEAEPIDLLGVSGAKGMAKRAVPVLIVVGIVIVAVVVWLIVR